MKTTILHWKRVFLTTLMILLLCVVGMTKAIAQTPYRQYADDGILLNFHEIDDVDFRMFLLYNLSHDDQFVLVADDTPGLFSVVSNNEENNTNYYVAFETFYQNVYADFNLLSKTDILSLILHWKSSISPTYLVSIMMDISLRNSRNDNYLCANSLPFYTTDVVQYEAATTSQTADQLEGAYFDDGCIGSSYNPSWYYMEVGNPGQFIIHLEGHDPNSGVDRDIDFCIWGPFTDPTTPCVSQLTTNKIMDCSYSAHYSEDIYLGYHENEHHHQTSHGTVNYHMPESGEYYILMITNYSRQPCIISFSQIGGNGTSGCNGQKTVTANVHPNGGGIVTGAGVYDCGSSCTLTATANVGYTFMDWTDNNGVVVSTDAEYTFTVWGNRSYTANFVEDNACYLTFNLFDSGEDGWSGNYLVLNFEDGSFQKLTVPYGLSSSSYALPIADGSHVSLGWISGAFTDQCSFIVSYSNGNGIYYSADLNDDLDYGFDVDCVGMPAMFYTITATANPNTGGTISCVEVPLQNDVYSFSSGDTCTLSALPNIGYVFENWKENGNVISTNTEFSFIVNSNRNFVANFTKVPLTITAIPNFDDRGTVSGAGEYLIDDTCTLTATANAGFAFANWTKDGAIVSTDAEYTFIVENEATFVANFVPFGNIVFADANAKSICVAQWDTNGDGELSYVEAAAVTDLGSYFQGNTGITSFNELQYFIGLSSIGANAFKNCSGLIFITLPNSVTSIGNSAFYGCSGWTGLLNLPSALTTIGSYAFYNCSGLIGGLTIPNTVNTIGDYAFSGCSGFMGLLTIGNSVTTIGNYAFQGCINFTGSINIPNSVITIGNYAFQGCTAFWGTLTIGNSVTSIGSYAFSGCTGLVGNIVIPNSVTSIGSNAFYDCHSFAGTLTIGNSVNSIGSYAFYNCYGLTGNLVIPNSVTSIGGYAFYNCNDFTGTLTIGNSVTSIGNSAFRGCSNLVGNIEIPHSVTTIGSEAFYYCNSFNGSLTIPSSVTTIGSRAFYYCSGLSEVYYNVTNHADINEGYYNYPFEGCGGHLNIGSNVIRIASNMFRNANFTGTLTIPNSVVAINDNAFNNCWHFTGTLVIPNSINTIGISAFQDCDGLSEIIMGNNVMIVGNTAFYSCSGLTKVTLPEPVTVIGIEAFRYCTQLNEVNMQSTQAPSIGWDVFSNNATGRIINIPCGAAANYADGYWSEWTDALNEMCDDYEITVEVNPSNAGSVTGAGYYYYSQMCTLTATGNLGYPFLNWTKNGVVVSTEATYSFGVTESCTYVANFSSTPVSYDITVAANLEEGGTVTGAGNYLHGETVTLTAMANEGYSFINWTKNNMVVSTSPTYSFIITEAGAYVANFELNTYEITATANPLEGGTVNGAGTYNYSSTCTLTATANEGYTFANWTENGVEVSTDANYSFTVTDDHDLVANFFPNYHWNVDIYQYPYNMSVTGIIQIYGEEQAVSSLEIGAFCGDVCRGTQRLTYYPQVDRYLVFLTLYGDAGDVMSFRLYDNSLGEELVLGCVSTISFVPDGFVGTALDPYVFDFGIMLVNQVTNFSQGYNWWCSYIEQEDIDGLGILQEGLGNNGLTIRSQANGYTDYYENYGWFGSLSSINNESSYRVITSAPCTVTMSGSAAVPSQHPITLSQGWTWIGYVPSTAMSVNVAMAGVDAIQGDKLKSQQGYADYYQDYGWFGSLNTIEPGMGLMYYSTNSNPVTFTYPDGGRGGELKANLTSENNHWKPNTYAYPDNMTVMAVVDLNDVELNSEHYELAAFANGECRGSVKLTYAEPLHRHVAFLTISGKDASELSFRLYNTETNEEYYDAEESLDFVADAIVGEATDLYTIHFRGTAGMDEFANRVQVYPNPVHAGERFSIGMANVETYPVHVEIVNALGVETLRATSVQTPVSIVAPATAGVYTLRITVEGKRTIVRKLVVK